MSNAKLIYDCPEKNADLFYAAKFLAPDPVLFLEWRGKKYLYLSDLEISRGKKEAKVDTVFPLRRLQRKARERGEKGIDGLLDVLFQDLKIREITVSPKAGFALVDALRKRGYHIRAGESPFYPARHIKTPAEKKAMRKIQRDVFRGIGVAEKILRASKIRNNFIYWKGKILTSERLRFQIESFLMEKGYRFDGSPIVAGGLQGTDPHCRGSGPLKAHQSIIVDVFPFYGKTGLFGDATRTFCKGKAPPKLKKMYEAVKAAQTLAISKVRAGVNGKTIYNAVVQYFDKSGFSTKEIGGVREGFIHGLGHGLGLEIHEEPVRIGTTDFILKAGHVVTVEPGLYYRDIGAVRIEDIVCVTKKGCEPFPTYPRRLEIP